MKSFIVPQELSLANIHTRRDHWNLCRNQNNNIVSYHRQIWMDWESHDRIFLRSTSFLLFVDALGHVLYYWLQLCYNSFSWLGSASREASHEAWTVWTGQNSFILFAATLVLVRNNRIVGNRTQSWLHGHVVGVTYGVNKRWNLCHCQWSLWCRIGNVTLSFYSNLTLSFYIAPFLPNSTFYSLLIALFAVIRRHSSGKTKTFSTTTCRSPKSKGKAWNEHQH